MEKEWDIIEVLRHSRHDWLNKLQLIKGNLDLNRIDRAKAIIDEIVIETQHETKLSNLQIPVFAAFLLKANWNNYIFRLEYEVLQDAHIVEIDEIGLTNWTDAFFDVLNSAAGPFGENLLVITIDSQNGSPRFFFDFSGIIKKKERIEQFLSGINTFGFVVEVKEFSESELAIEVVTS